MGAVAARIIYKDMAHQLRGGGKKVDAGLPVSFLMIDKAQICFVNQRRSLKRVIWPLTTQIAACDLMEFVVDQRDQLIQSCLISLSPIDEVLGYVFC
jgi:hypothetical protein